MKLRDKVAIVTGGAQGIGRAIVEGRALEVACDVSDEAQVEAMAQAALRAFGGIDILVNNAGIYSTLVPKAFEEITAAEWRRMMDVNTLGVFLCCRAAVGPMRARGGGRIININSGTPFKGVPFLLHYVASKGAITSITRGLAKELGPSNILVNGVAPGFTLSEGVKANPVQLDKLSEVSVKARSLARDQFPE